MLRNSRRAKMSTCVKTPTSVTTPVMLCKLCHCEFTNFKEHVKSLVHLDARETSSTPKPASKHKNSDEDSGECAKKPKTEVNEEKTSPCKNIEESDESKLLVSSDGKIDTLVPTVKMEKSSSSSSQEGPAEGKADNADLNGTSTTKTNEKEVSDNRTEEQIEIENYARAIGKDLTQAEKSFLNNHWQCGMCTHVHRLEDGSFDEHAHDESHKKSLECRLNSLRQSYTWRKRGCQWLLNCTACSFHTNDKAQYISHLQTELHDQNVKEVIGNNRIALSDDKPWNRSRERRERKQDEKKTAQSVTSNVPQKDTNSKQPSKPSPVIKQNNTNSKPFTPQTQVNKATPITTPGKSYQEKSQGSTSAPRNVKLSNPAKRNPKPLMSLSLPETLNQTKSGWTSTVTRNQSTSNKPGILGEYRPDLSNNRFGFDGLNRGEPFGRSADRPDSLTHPRIGSSSLSGGRPTYSEINRNPLSSSAPLARTFELDSYRSAFDSDRYNSVWSELSTLPAPTEKLNTLAFGRVEPQSPSRQFDILSNLLSSQRTGMLPSSVSLDLASNSSIRYKFSSDRGAMFDSYPASRPDLSRTDFTRNNLPRADLSRQGLSRPDPFSRSMYSRR